MGTDYLFTYLLTHMQFLLLFQILDIIENPREVQIGNWVVVEYALPNASSRRFISQIFKCYNGRLYGKFLRPATTREHSGYIYKFPVVEDVAKVSFNQIKKLLPPPQKYGRGLFKFCINAKNL